MGPNPQKPQKLVPAKISSLKVVIREKTLLPQCSKLLFWLLGSRPPSIVGMSGKSVEGDDRFSDFFGCFGCNGRYLIYMKNLIKSQTHS